MAIIRLASLLERPEFAATARVLTHDEVASIRTTRNIAAHAGYTGMNDDLFWLAITGRLPGIVEKLLSTVNTSHAQAPTGDRQEPPAAAASVTSKH